MVGFYFAKKNVFLTNIVILIKIPFSEKIINSEKNCAIKKKIEL